MVLKCLGVSLVAKEVVWRGIYLTDGGDEKRGNRSER